MNQHFTPRLVLFQCRYCLYSDSDQQWVDTQLPKSIKLIKTPCTGRISPHFLLNALQAGADGILICGCMPQKCHFKEGNLGARRQLDEFVRLLIYLGMEPERVRFSWIDLDEQGRIQREIGDFEDAIRGLGPARQLKGEEKPSTPCSYDNDIREP